MNGSTSRRGGAGVPGIPALALVRPRHWIKNLFVLAPLVFAGRATDPDAVGRALLATLLFTVASAVVYVLNDLTDRRRDRLHPLKRRTRPLASGQVSVGRARAVALVLAVGLAVGLSRVPGVAVPVAAYLAVNAAYSLWLKRVPVLDLLCVASGFLLRVWAGAGAIDVEVSTWMGVTTLCLALYLAALKRRQELATRGDEGRPVLSRYTVGLLDRYARLSGTAALVFYGLYVIEVRPWLAVTVPLVVFGLVRYWLLVHDRGQGESPTDAVWSDRWLAGTVVLWGLVSAWVVHAG